MSKRATYTAVSRELDVQTQPTSQETLQHENLELGTYINVLSRRDHVRHDNGFPQMQCAIVERQQSSIPM